MKEEDITPGIVVRNKKTGKIGVPFTGYDYGCINPDVEVAIVYQSDDEKPGEAPPFEGTLFGNLELYELKLGDLLTQEHVNKVCKPNTEKTCRYLIVGKDGFECAKVLGDTSIAHHLDNRVRNDSIRATGNNCGGRYKSQPISGN